MGSSKNVTVGARQFVVYYPAQPAFLAAQLGHSLRVSFDIYEKWISSRDDRLEMEKVDRTISKQLQNNSKLAETGD